MAECGRHRGLTLAEAHLIASTLHNVTTPQLQPRCFVHFQRLRELGICRSVPPNGLHSPNVTSLSRAFLPVVINLRLYPVWGMTPAPSFTRKI